MPNIRANNINLHYEVEGEGEPLLLIHGLGSSTRDWEFQVPEFSRTYKRITFDLRGHGQSDKPAGPYSIPQFAADAAGLLEALIVKSAHVVGISLGGCVALQLAIDFPERVKSLVIVNSGPVGVGTNLEGQQEINRRVAIVEQQGMQAMGMVLSQRLFPKPEHASLRQTFVERWTENNPRAYVDALLAMVGWNVTDKLGGIRCPTLVISADQDYTPVSMKEAYVKLMPNARLVVISDARHATPIEEPSKFNAALMQFLSSLPA